MQQELISFGTIFMGLFAIMNPIANVPIFLALTDGDDAETRRTVARRSVLLAFLIVVVFALTGKLIFELFGLTFPAFRITGGLLVVVIGFQMIHGNHSLAQHPNTAEKSSSREAALSVAVTPLAMPILAGPGTIATAMNFSAKGGFMAVGMTIAAFAFLCFLTNAAFQGGERLVAFLGTAALGVITRLMGLILAALGVSMLIEGIQGAFHLAG